MTTAEQLSVHRADPAVLDACLVPLDLLEERTGPIFSSLRGHAPTTELQQRDAVLVEDAEQVNW